MYYTQEQIDRANQADLVSFLQSQGEQLTRAGQTKPRAPIRLPTTTPQHRQPHSEELPHSSPPH